VRDGKTLPVDEAVLASLLVCYADGRISNFIRSEFARKPTELFAEQWSGIKGLYFV